MVYLRTLTLPNIVNEHDMMCHMKNIHVSYYPLNIFPDKQLSRIEFDPITIFCGGNGSGKTTILRIIADTIGAYRKNAENRGELFKDYVESCRQNCTMTHMDECMERKFISSDDVFDYLLDMRAISSDINRRKQQLVDEYYEYRDTPAKNYLDTHDRYEDLKNKIDTNHMTVSRYVRTRLRNNNPIQESNGETALDFWQNEIKENALYIIDEPENSLSAENQLKLKAFIEESARFFRCQFIIATHSPFLLGLEQARIYDLDSVPVKVRKWTELENIRTYHEFFKQHEDDFE